MTDLEQRFVEEYCIDQKGAKAAVRAGYEKARAKQTAYDLKQKPEIRAAIDERLKQLTLTADEATKNISDMARTRLQDFMVIKKVLRRPTVRKSLKILIKELESDIEFEQEYERIGDLDKGDLKRQKAKIKDLEQSLIRYQIELRRNPKAYRDVEGEAQWEERAEFDLVALAKANDLGNIHEFSFTEFGPKIKMYAADKANETILKLNGKLIDRVDHTTKGKSFGDFLMESE